MPRLRAFYPVDAARRFDFSDTAGQAVIYENLEAIRQWLLAELVESYDYPPEFIAERCRAGSDFELGHGVTGFCLLTSSGKPFLWVLCSEPGKADQAELALRNVLTHGATAGLGIASDGDLKGTRFLRRRFDTEKCEFVPDIEVFRRPPPLLSVPCYMAGASAEAPGLVPLTEGVEDVFFEAHSHIRDIDGMHADEALDEVCKILYTKLYDEEFTCPTTPYRMQRVVYGTTEELAATVRDLYAESNEYDVRVFALKIPGYKRSRGVFNTPFRLSSPALAKVVETLQDYTVSGSPTDVKGRAFQKVFNPAIRAGMGQYFTPAPVIRFMVDVCRPAVSDLILDPFCGSGHFLSACLEFVRTHADTTAEKRLHEFAFGKLHGIEKSDRMVRVAMTDMRLQGDGHSNIRCTDALLDFLNYSDLQPESFDVVLTNPPFGCLLGPEALGQLARFELATGRKSVPLEILGLERCIQFLRPGGRLAIVLPDGLLANRGSTHVRQWLESRVRVRSIISLPIETFSPFGANIKTSLLFARKLRKGERVKSDYPLFLGRVDSVGYDATGRLRDDSELDAVRDELLAFLSREGW